MKLILLVTPVLFSMLFAGCNNLSDAQSVTASAYRDLAQGDTKAFENTLTAEAYDQWATPGAEGHLQQVLDGKKLSVGDEQYLGRRVVDAETIEFSYNVPVYGDKALILTVGVVCDRRTQLNCESGYPSYPYPPNVPSAGCGPIVIDTCLINSIAE